MAIDYARANREHRKLKAALTRASNSGDPEKVKEACRKALREWDRPDSSWPDNWSNWQRALDDCLPWHARIELRELDY